MLLACYWRACLPPSVCMCEGLRAQADIRTRTKKPSTTWYTIDDLSRTRDANAGLVSEAGLHQGLYERPRPEAVATYLESGYSKPPQMKPAKYSYMEAVIVVSLTCTRSHA